MTLGAGIGARDAIYLLVSGGVGAGLILGGELGRGTGGTAGELGHMLVDESGPICRCGDRGCLEMTAGGPAILSLLRSSHGDDLLDPLREAVHRYAIPPAATDVRITRGVLGERAAPATSTRSRRSRASTRFRRTSRSTPGAARACPSSTA